jgi:hydrogenase maturation protease
VSGDGPGDRLAGGKAGGMRTLVIGLGSPLLTDDSVGLKVAQEVRRLLGDRPGVEIEEDVRGGLQLMERLAGYDRAIIVDAILTGAAPGTIHRLTPDDIPTQRSASQHDVNLPTALELGRQLGMHLPASAQILLVGIEADDILTFSEECTPAVAAAIPRAAHVVLEALEQ